MKQYHLVLRILWPILTFGLFLTVFWYAPVLQEAYLMERMREPIVWHYAAYYSMTLGFRLLEGFCLALTVPPWEYRLRRFPAYLLPAGLLVFFFSIVPFLHQIFAARSPFAPLASRPLLLAGCQMALGLLLGVFLAFVWQRGLDRKKAAI